MEETARPSQLLAFGYCEREWWVSRRRSVSLSLSAHPCSMFTYSTCSRDPKCPYPNST